MIGFLFSYAFFQSTLFGAESVPTTEKGLLLIMVFVFKE